MTSSSNKKYFLLNDILLIVVSIVVALLLIKTDALEKILNSTQEFHLLGSFITGIFFTSIFTTAPAIVTLGEISQNNSIVLTAIFGALGAVVGDLVIFQFVKDRLSEHIMELVNHQSGGKRIRAVFKRNSFKWLAFLIGGLIIASPLPDELGISFLGFSKMKLSRFIAVSFIFNFIGIFIIGLVATAL